MLSTVVTFYSTLCLVGSTYDIGSSISNSICNFSSISSSIWSISNSICSYSSSICGLSSSICSINSSIFSISSCIRSISSSCSVAALVLRHTPSVFPMLLHTVR